jgi:L-amino acid N-acyltransferase
MIKVRMASPEDLPAMLEIYNDVILHTTAVYDYQPHTLEMRKVWYEAKQQAGFEIFIAEEFKKLIGFSSYGPFRAWAAYQYTVENSVYVSSDQRGKGVGKRLLAPLIQAAQNKGMHTLVAGIDDTNLASLRLHAHFGFKEVARFKEVGYKFDRWLNLIFLQLMLSSNP